MQTVIDTCIQRRQSIVCVCHTINPAWFRPYHTIHVNALCTLGVEQLQHILTQSQSDISNWVATVVVCYEDQPFTSTQLVKLLTISSRQHAIIVFVDHDKAPLVKQLRPHVDQLFSSRAIMTTIFTCLDRYDIKGALDRYGLDTTLHMIYRFCPDLLKTTSWSIIDRFRYHVPNSLVKQVLLSSVAVKRSGRKRRQWVTAVRICDNYPTKQRLWSEATWLVATHCSVSIPSTLDLLDRIGYGIFNAYHRSERYSLVSKLEGLHTDTQADIGRVSDALLGLDWLDVYTNKVD